MFSIQFCQLLEKGLLKKPFFREPVSLKELFSTDNVLLFELVETRIYFLLEQPSSELCKKKILKKVYTWVSF